MLGLCIRQRAMTERVSQYSCCGAIVLGHTKNAKVALRFEGLDVDRKSDISEQEELLF